MTRYVETGYWETGYAEGDVSAVYIAASVNASSDTDIATAVKFSTGIAPDGSSAMLTGTGKTGLFGLLAAGQSDVDIGISSKTGIAASAVSVSELMAAVTALRQAGFKSASNGIMNASFRLKWENEQEPSDGWTDSQEPTDSWSEVLSAGGGWSDSSEPADIWTDVTEPTEGWS